ncbi:hypothetical protein [Streptomyces sp. TP-A0874]|uniref:hypothetical protein n=1 Tax=Streptomyces sp. TP-A0874 TaxID=549819 RepID=UPI0008534AA1|nr:hypothetical protein [Streptomyces sp. TP-A0874]
MLDQVVAATHEKIGTRRQGSASPNLIADANWASCQKHPWIGDIAPGRPVHAARDDLAGSLLS